jgi:serine/threonine protein kinase
LALETAGGLLDDKYEVLKRLASGGMGDVYLVRHKHLQQLRVVKVLRAELASDQAVAQRFQQEARVATQIKHPNVAILYDYSLLADGRYYMVWEYIEGQDLGQRLRSDGPLAPSLALELAIQALRGLDAIHAAGVIHRDISPDNLMVTTDRSGKELVKIIDLGLAKDMAPGKGLELTQAGSFLGKFQYCSPEQADSSKERAVDKRSDLYSLAQVLYEMVTGLPPFDSESQHGFIVKRLLEDPIPLSLRNPALELPKALEEVVMKGLAKDRDHRHPDAPAFIRALVGVISQLQDPSPEAKTVIATQPRVAATAASTSQPPSGSAAPPGRPVEPSGVTSRMTREERLELLAKIEGVGSRPSPVPRPAAANRAEKAPEIDGILSAAEVALKEGRFEEARQRLLEVEKSSPGLVGVEDLERRLADAEQIARRRQQVLQAEQMLEKYLLERQQTLAGLTLETLLDLYPNHPKRNDYQSWVALLADEAAQQKRAEQALGDARAAIARGELAAARELLDEVEHHDVSGKLAGTLLSELQVAEQAQSSGQRAAEVRQRFEAHVREGDLAQAEQDIAELSSLEVTRVTLDGYRSLLEEARLRREQEEVKAPFEERFQKAVEARDWGAAREAARELGERLPEGSRAGEMLAHVIRLQDAEQREKALAEGVRALDGYLAAGDLSQAELALRVLRQLGPQDRRVLAAEKRLKRKAR